MLLQMPDEDLYLRKRDVIQCAATCNLLQIVLQKGARLDAICRYHRHPHTAIINFSRCPFTSARHSNIFFFSPLLLFASTSSLYLFPVFQTAAAASICKRPSVPKKEGEGDAMKQAVRASRSNKGSQKYIWSSFWVCL